MEASGHGRWFERLLEGLGVELWRGDAEVIRAKRGRKQKTDREDARHILKLLLKDDFPRIWVSNWEPGNLGEPGGNLGGNLGTDGTFTSFSSHTQT